jgi:ABC-type multidrug transport system ATPase subunit
MGLVLSVSESTHLLDEAIVYTLGRAEGSDIVIQNGMVSRQHCRIYYDSDSWVLQDSGSSHGTFVEGKRVHLFRIVADMNGNLGGTKGVDFSIRVIATPQPLIPEKKSSVYVPTVGPRISLGQRIRIGTDSRNDWVLEELGADPFHAEINRTTQNIYELIDLKSVNGCYLNGNKVLRSLLHDGDVIRIGESQKRFTLDGLEDVQGVRGARVKLSSVWFETETNVTLLRDINLNLGPATLTAIVGPSGAGKSTMMDVITGKKSISSGKREIRLENESGNYNNIGFVPQADILHTKLTVMQALEYGADLRFLSSTTKVKKLERIHEVLSLVELESRADLRIDKLSGGQRKRCSIALELLSKPDVLVLDEPTSGLDPGLDLHFMELLKRLTVAGQTVIVVTHAVDNVGLCDNVVLLRTGGTIAYFGPPKTILQSTKQESWAHLFRSVSQPIEEIENRSFESSNDPIENIKEVVSQQSTLNQILTLSRRYVSVIMADKFYLTLMAILPLMLGFIGYASGNDFGLSQNVTSKGLLLPNPQSQMLALILILGSVFLALAASIQEIVKEGDIFERELRLGVRTVSYFMSKLLVLGLVVTFQITGFFLFTFFGRIAGESALIFESSKLEILAICLTLGISCLCLGLLISTLINSQEQGMPTLVLVTMAQIVISGALPIRIDWLTQNAGLINPAYWAMNGIGASANLNLVTALEGAEAFNRWNHLAANVQAPFTVLYILSIVFALLAILSLGRRK